MQDMGVSCNRSQLCSPRVKRLNVILLAKHIIKSLAELVTYNVARTQNIFVAIVLSAMRLVHVANTQGTWERGPTWAIIDGKLSGY